MTSFTVELIQLVVERALRLELQVDLVQLQCRERVLDRVVRVRLDVFLEDEPGQETQRQSSLAVLEVIQVNGVDDLLWRDEDVWNMDRVKCKSMAETVLTTDTH